MTTQELRQDSYNREGGLLADVLDAIPFTSRQRSDIDYRLAQMKELFEEANKNSKD